MASIINASNSTGLTLTSDLSGVLQFQNNGVNLPMSGVAPTFSAYHSSTQSVPNNTQTKVQYQTELWDTNNNFDSVTNYRFTPTVAGYYQVNAVVAYGSNWTQEMFVSIWKNGSEYKRGFDSSASGSSPWSAAVNGIVYCNGSTDYIEIYTYQNSGSSKTTYAGQPYCWFDSCLIRGA